VTAYDAVMDRFDALTQDNATTAWVGRHEPALVGRPVAYFSAEFGLHPSLPIYSGGLGVLAGDHIKTASDLGLPLFAVSLLYRQGYLRQRLDADGWQLDVPAELEPWGEPTTPMLAPDGRPRLVEVAFEDPAHPVRLAVWVVQVGRVPLFLLDADVEGNPDWTRTISSRLYGGDKEHRLRQEIILGIGGVRALRAVGLDPAYWHGNEGHAAFTSWSGSASTSPPGCPSPRPPTASGGRRSSPATRRSRPATTSSVRHQIDRYFGPLLARARARPGGVPGAGGARRQRRRLQSDRPLDAPGRAPQSASASATARSPAACGTTSGRAPSRPACRSPRSTNGVHLPTWISPPVQGLLGSPPRRRLAGAAGRPDRLGGGARHPGRRVLADPPGRKRELLAFLRSTPGAGGPEGGGLEPGQVVAAGPFLEPGVLTIGFARRFATYKRATLIFSDPDRLARIVNNAERPVQIVFAGKAHPADDGGKRLIRRSSGAPATPA
jgi:starch phosphorylase